MFKKIKGAVAMAAFAVAATGGAPVSADVMDEIKARGVVRIGVKADYKPYGFRDPSGAIIGIEPDLSQDVADALGVDVEFVPVVGSNRMQFLQQGKIDLMIATMTDRPDRRELIWIVSPNYYSSGTNIIAKKSFGFTAWEDLRGKPVCGIQGAFYNKKTGKEFGADIIAFKGTAEVYSALTSGRCVAFVFDDSAIVAKLQEAAFADYEMPLETIDDASWGLAVQHGEKALHDFMADMVRDWHASGRILALEEKWGVNNTPFAVQMNTEWNYYQNGNSN